MASQRGRPLPEYPGQREEALTGTTPCEASRHVVAPSAGPNGAIDPNSFQAVASGAIADLTDDLVRRHLTV